MTYWLAFLLGFSLTGNFLLVLELVCERKRFQLYQESGRALR